MDAKPVGDSMGKLIINQKCENHLHQRGRISVSFVRQVKNCITGAEKWGEYRVLQKVRATRIKAWRKKYT